MCKSDLPANWPRQVFRCLHLSLLHMQGGGEEVEQLRMAWTSASWIRRASARTGLHISVVHVQGGGEEVEQLRMASVVYSSHPAASTGGGGTPR